MTQPCRCTDRCNRMSDRGLCDWCARRAAAELAELPELWTALCESLEPNGGHGDGRGTGEPGSGVRIDVLSFTGPASEPRIVNGEPHAADQSGTVPLVAILAGWAELVMQERRFASRARLTFATARAYLVAQHDWICRQAWADDYAAELHEVWCTARALTNTWTSPELLRNRYCPWCKMGCLYQERRDGSGVIECQPNAGGCGSWWTSAEHYEQTVRMRAAYEKANGAA
jgi:hypothetical protein